MKRLNVPYIWQGSIPRCHVTSLSMILQRLQKISSILKEIADLEEESGTLMKGL
jgi:hypothetical protein